MPQHKREYLRQSRSPAAALAVLQAEGGSQVGEVVSVDIRGAGQIRFVYARDPEGNIIELQHTLEERK